MVTRDKARTCATNAIGQDTKQSAAGCSSTICKSQQDSQSTTQPMTGTASSSSTTTNSGTMTGTKGTNRHFQQHHTTAKQQQKRTSDPSSQHSWESLGCSFGLHQRHQHEQRGRDDRQWSGNTCLPTLVWQRVPANTLTNYEEPDLILVTSNEIPVYGYRWIHFNNENDQSVVPGETTYPICVKADTLGIWDQLQQGHTRSEAQGQGVLQHDAEEQERLILHQVDGRNNAARNAAENWDSDSGEQTSSNDSANNSDTTRATNDERRQHTHTHSHTHTLTHTHMGNEQRRTSCPNPQKVEESTLHAFQHGLS